MSRKWLLTSTFRANDRLYCYFSVLNVLSNFRFAPIHVDGILWEHNEKYIQWKKGDRFNDTLTCIKIMESENPYECKRLGHTVRGFNEEAWLAIHEDVAMTCNRIKYQTHEAMADFLVRTHPREIGEASKELPWGCGLMLKDDDIMDHTQWPRKNGTMGNILMKIRRDLIEQRKQASSATCRSTMNARPM